jgi:hypothetical protein
MCLGQLQKKIGQLQNVFGSGRIGNQARKKKGLAVLL